MTIRVTVADDAERFLQTDLIVWAGGCPALTTEDVVNQMRPDQRFAAASDDPSADPRTYAGVYGSYDLEVSLPGPQHSVRVLPVAGLTWVGVHPDERRQGVLTAMLRDHFERTAAREQSGISVLHASEAAIYGRFGYGLASLEGILTLSAGATFTAPHLDATADKLRTRLDPAAEDDCPARMRAIALKAAASAHGQVVREEHTYAGYVREAPEDLRDKEPSQVLFAIADGDDVGYALLRREPKFENDQPAGTVSVNELVGTPAAQLALVRRLVDFDLMTTAKIHHVGRDSLVWHWTKGARAVQGTLVDSLWVRLVDLPKALAARGYSAAGEVVIDVADDFIPEQSGRWRVVADSDGIGRAERTSDPADLHLTTQQIAASYLGDGSVIRLVQAGLAVEHRAGAAATFDAMFRTAVAAAGAVGF